jgi:hypothetical protein
MEEGSVSTMRYSLLTKEPELQHSRGTEHLSLKCCMLCARGRRLPAGASVLLLLEAATFMPLLLCGVCMALCGAGAEGARVLSGRCSEALDGN